MRFGECHFDPGARALSRGGAPVPLSPRGFDLLVLLLGHRPRPLSHRQLHDALWPDTHVGYTSLAHLITELRRAIGDEAPGVRLIRTIPKFGYAFVGSVTEESATTPPGLVGMLVGDDRDHGVRSGETLVGRGAECGIQLASPSVSRVHARLWADANGVTIEDAGSKNGTWVNGTRVDLPSPLRDGDEVALGRCRLVFQRATSSRSTHTVTVQAARRPGRDHEA